jgi:hypothetical protein
MYYVCVYSCVVWFIQCIPYSYHVYLFHVSFGYSLFSRSFSYLRLDHVPVPHHLPPHLRSIGAHDVHGLDCNLTI